MPKKLDPKVAEKVMLKAGLQPKEAYTNSKTPWKCKCLTCGKTVTPTYSHVKEGHGCTNCAGNMPINVEDANQKFLEAGFIVLTKHQNSRGNRKVKCIKCDQVSEKAYKQLMKNAKCIWCSGQKLDIKKQMEECSKKGFVPLEPYKNSFTPWKCKHIPCGKIVYPSWNTIKSSTVGCKHCSRTYVDPKEAIKFMISKGYKPQVPYTSVHINWKCIHIPCGNIVSPTYAQIQQGMGGCRHCAEWGFQYDKKSYLYLITNPSLNAHKVGIANVAKRIAGDRLIRMQNDGWVVFKVWHFDEGKRVLNIEKEIFKILRIDMKLPAYLSAGEMKHEGETETVDADEITLLQLEKIIKKVIKGL